MSPVGAFFDSYYRLRPVNATFTGVHDHDDRLPDWSPDGLAAAADEMRSVRASLSDGTPEAATGDVADRDRVLAAAFLDVQLAELDGLHFQRGNPSLALGEATFGIISLVTRPFAPAAARAKAVAARLSAWPAFLAGARASIADGVPDEWRAKTLRECGGAARLLESGVDLWMANEAVSNPDVTAALPAARAALEEFRSWLVAAPAAAPSRYAVGPDDLALFVRRGHFCERSPAELLTDARAALDDALDVLSVRARRAATGGWPEVQARLADAHPATGDYLAAFQRTWDACRSAADAADLVTWPDYPIRYVPIPPHTREAAPSLYYLFYRSPAPFDRLPVHDYVVTPIDESLPPDEQQRRLRANNTSVITLNHVVHHGAIGHHVQNWFAYAGPSQIGRVAAVDCANRIGMFLGGTMAEGWACYATDLMDEIGFFTPDQSLAQQHTRARLLARAVVDLALHSGSMTFDDAVALYRDRIGMAPEAARAEACKNSMFPGTAVMYWLGTDGLHRLRRSRERADGPSFSLKRFHDRVLSFGSIPVPLLARIW